ncbi:diguanylate cyclase with PAS/PAC sensor [Sulfurimonas autotrophica DSM 16294]|uniref:Diguanylate cyclase with PAS/PAC sensor n=2 Tax=Sulfurimonas autotrophica TaxID=202747 RepID=E0UUD6_SULAO|nr:diguanylate cyclase with PAS/PAC sensor [Sulfurimonas autotrophica DSM 16294]
MNLKSLQMKIILIFSLPAVALIYFSYSLVHSNYIKYQESTSYASSAKHTHILSKLIHNLQLERGLSAGYIVSKNETIKKNLKKQYNLTDDSYKNLINFSNEHPQFIKKFKKMKIIRQKLLTGKLNFSDEIKYYNGLNKDLLNAISLLMHNLKSKLYNGKALIELQKLKEYLGQERAYSYNQILARNKNEKYIKYIQLLQKKEEKLKTIFSVCASTNTRHLFKQIVHKETLEKMNHLRKIFYLKKLSSKEDAKIWFQITSQYITQIYNVSSQILNTILKDAVRTQKDIRKVFIFTVILWILSILSFLFLVYILNALINKEEKLLKRIRIASYTFDSHEAIVITDKNGIVLEVNKSFTRITGYEADEIIGHTTKILKSDKHSREFYANMWGQLLTSGKWSGDIYNKRKNGEIYPERLSISAIKNENGDIINFIAQFYDISDLRSAQEEAVYQANHDFLTGLFNRKLLLQRLHEENSKALRHNFIHAFLFIDLDNFKSVNDTYGHHIGDELLIQVSQRMKSLLREEDILARMSGDEFAVILVNIANSKEAAKKYAEKKCQSIIDALSQAFVIEGNEIYIGASIGIKIFPDEKNNIEDIINDADKAMYVSKKHGKNSCSLYCEI